MSASGKLKKIDDKITRVTITRPKITATHVANESFFIGENFLYYTKK